MAFLTIASIFYWMLLIITPYRRHLVLHALQLAPNQNIKESYTSAFYFGEDGSYEQVNSFLIDKTGMSLMENFEKFFEHVCSIDVVFIVKLISLNSNSMAFRDILNHLWDTYLNLDELKMKDVTHRPAMMPLRRQPILPSSTILRNTSSDRMHNELEPNESGTENEDSKFMKS